MNLKRHSRNPHLFSPVNLLLAITFLTVFPGFAQENWTDYVHMIQNANGHNGLHKTVLMTDFLY